MLGPWLYQVSCAFVHAVPLPGALPRTVVSHCAFLQQQELHLMVSVPQDLKCTRYFSCLMHTWWMSCPLAILWALKKSGWLIWQTFDPRQGVTETVPVSAGIGTQWKLSYFFSSFCLPPFKKYPVTGINTNALSVLLAEWWEKAMMSHVFNVEIKILAVSVCWRQYLCCCW